MVAIILAAGTGKRLLPYTKHLPKCLLNVGGQPILYWQLSAIQKCDISHVYIVHGDHLPLIQEQTALFNNLDIKFVANPTPDTTNNLYSYMLALRHINEPYILMNGDTMFHPDMLKELIQNTSDNVMAVVRKDCIPEDMKVFVKDRRITRVSKKLDDAYGEFTGVAKLSLIGDYYIRLLKTYDKNCWFEHALDNLVQAINITALDVTHYPTIEIDFYEDWREADEIFRWGMPDWEFGIRHGSNVNVTNAKCLLFDLLDILDKHKIKHWLNWGLLLGAVRDGGFIPWDTDMDVTCHVKDKPKILDIVDLEMHLKGCFIPKKEVCYPEDHWYIRDKEKIELNFVEDCGERYVYSPDRCVLGCPKSYIDELDEIEFLGRKVKIPSNAKEYLRLSYGNDWQTPIKDKKPVDVGGN